MGILGSLTSIGGMIVGGLIGSLIYPGAGTMAGIAIGGAIGGIAGSVLFPEKIDINHPPPPAPHENRVQISTYGAPVPIQYGSGRMAGNIIYMSDVVETITRSRHRQDGVRYYEMVKTYTATFAIAFCEGPVEGIARIWVNGKIFVDFRDPTMYPPASEGLASGNLETSIARSETYFRMHYGAEDQVADTSIAALITDAETPAYRGLVYIVFIDFPVGEYSGVPTIEVEIGSIPHGIWVERRPIDDADYEWKFTASDGDGSTLLVGKGSSAAGYLYVSTDYGLTWRQAGAEKFWQAGCLNRTGQYGMAVDYLRLYITGDYGVTWTEARPVGDANRTWCDTAISADGAIMVVVANNQRAYRSADYGATWTEVRPAGDVNAAWWRCAMSADGTVLILALATSSVYISTDSGATWTQRQPTGGATGVPWGGLDCSEDGAIIIITMDNGRIYVSTDTGATWDEKRPAGDTNQNWRGAACGGDGLIMASTNTSALYVSYDSGATWEANTPGVGEVLGWIDMDDTGGNLIIACAKTYTGRVWTYRA